jgi:hypothetical protein
MTYRILSFGILFSLFCACKKQNEFQSCANFEKIRGEWTNIDGDTKVNLIFYDDGVVEQSPGTERRRRIHYSSCSYKQKYNVNGYYFLFNSDDHSGYYDINQTFDTFITGSGAVDHTYDEQGLIYKMRFIKVK